MPRPRFSIITTTYNRANNGLLEQCILSVKEQSNASDISYEHIIIDDGSTDNTKQYMKQQTKTDNSIVYLYQKNGGPAKAIQNGIKNAKGEYIIILDDDDMLTPDSLSLRNSYIAQNKGVGFVYGLADWIDDYGIPMVPLFQSKPPSDYLYEDLLITNCICAGTPTIRTDLLRDIAWPAWLSRSQDYFLWLEANRPEKNTKVGFIDQDLVHYRYHTANYTVNINDDSKKRLKQELNARIRTLHDDRLSYLAEKAKYWIDEAHAGNDFRLAELKTKNARIEELQTELNYYAHSRVVKVTIKGRNVIRGQVLDRARRASDKIKKGTLLLRPAAEDSYVTNERWDNKKPLVSIITPVYNRSTLVPDTIRSVLGQSFQDFEYIIVDDGSTDEDTKRYLDRLSHPKIKVIRKENGGVASARNTGIQQAKGKYVMCLDDDDELHSTFVEKAVILLESKQDVSIVTFYMQMFGKVDKPFKHADYNPLALIEDNPIITASLYRREVWNEIGGYKQDIGYEDWEFWVSAAERGYFAATIPETLFRYRTAESSRYVDDLLKHDLNSATIKTLHPQYQKAVIGHIKKQASKQYSTPETAMINMDRPAQYKKVSDKKHILTIVPWLPFGGAETYAFNFMSKLTNAYDYSIITGIADDHVWDEKFQQVTPRIYHLANLYPNSDYYYAFIENYIDTRNVDIIHIVHSGYAFPMLEKLKKQFPRLRIVVTLFNARVDDYVMGVRNNAGLIDVLISDNQVTINEIAQGLEAPIDRTRVIPSGVDCKDTFNPGRYNREENRKAHGIKLDEKVVLFAGRLSEEKNPEIFIHAMDVVTKSSNTKAIIVGDGPLREECEQLLSELKNDNILYVGYQTDIAKYLSMSDIFVLPSSIEGFPLSILEAMAMGLAVVASRVGAIPEVILDDENGATIQPGIASEVVDAVQKLIDDPSLLQQIKENNRAIAVAEYSDDTPSEAYHNVYREVLKG